MQRKKVIILGSTGSIGTSALKVARDVPDRMEVVGLAAAKSVAATSVARRRAIAVLLVPGGETSESRSERLPDYTSAARRQADGGHILSVLLTTSWACRPHTFSRLPAALAETPGTVRSSRWRSPAESSKP